MNWKMLRKMSVREQALTFITVAIFVLGAYILFRYYPASKDLDAMNKSTLSMEKAVKSGRIPELPMEDVTDLNATLAEVESELETAHLMAVQAESRLNKDDSTAVRLAVSEVARKALVRISVNEEFRVAGTSTTTGSAVAVNMPRVRNLTKSDERKDRRIARQSAARARANTYNAAPVQTKATVSPALVTELVGKMGVGSPLERPMQRLTMEGTYAGIVRFIQGLEAMDEMVTVVQVQISATPQTPPPGYNQRLSATMVLAL